MRIKVLSWNIWNGVRFTEVLDFLQTTDADIIGLQEIIQNADGTNNLAEIIAKAIGYNWAWGITFRSQEQDGRLIDWGNAILTKHKIGATKTHVLDGGLEHTDLNRRTAFEADIHIGDDILNVISTHLLHVHQKPSSTQELQGEKLLQFTRKERGIVMGDFNATPDSLVIKTVSRTLHNTDEKLLPTWCLYKDGCNVCLIDRIEHKLDYIFTTPDLSSHNFVVENTPGSDHLPISVLVDI